MSWKEWVGMVWKYIRFLVTGEDVVVVIWRGSFNTGIRCTVVEWLHREIKPFLGGGRCVINYGVLLRLMWMLPLVERVVGKLL